MSFPPIRVLVVDDEPDLCILTKEFLGASGEMEVNAVFSVPEAWEALRAGHYQVIVSDYQMPFENGIEFLKALRAKGDDTPFVLFTGKGREEVVIEALNNGADAYLQKGGMPRPMYAELEHRIRAAVSKRRTEDEVARTLSILASTMESTADGILVVDDKGKIVLSNAVFKRMWNLPDSIIDTNEYDAALRLVLDQLRDPDAFTGKIRELNRSPEKTSLDVLELKDGRVLERYSQPQRLGHPILGRVWSFRDITERNRIEMELRESEEFHRHLMSNLALGMVVIDPVTRVIETVNDTAAAMFGSAKENILGHRCHSFLCPALEGACPVIDLGKQVDNSEKVLLCSDGSKRPILKTVRKTSIRGKEKLLECFLDITEQKQTEEALKENEEKFREIFNHANDAIQVNLFTGGFPGLFIDVNDVACRMLGYTREEMLRLGPQDITTGFHDPSVETCMEGIRTHGSATFRTEHRRKDGTTVPVEISVHTTNQRDKKIAISVVRDISETKRNMSALKTANEKLNLLSGITRHDINNQLMALKGYLTLMEGEDAAQRSEHLRKAETAAERITSMIQFTKTYEDIGVNVPTWQNIRSLVDECAADVNHGKIELVNDLPGDIEIFADPLIFKVFYNLIDNAVRHGDDLTRIRFYATRENDRQSIVCEDDGPGIPEDMKEKLFIRSLGTEHGLGLFLSREILAITGISIRENGDPDNGARFSIIAPEGGIRVVG